jgi:hypothetical protein
MSAAPKKTRAELIREKANRLNQAAAIVTPSVERNVAAEPEPVSASRRAPGKKAPAAAPSVKTKDVRSTVDLSPTEHAKLKLWCAQMAVELGQSRVTTQDVLATLVRRMLTDANLEEKIKRDLRAQ